MLYVWYTDATYVCAFAIHMLCVYDLASTDGCMNGGMNGCLVK